MIKKYDIFNTPGPNKLEKTRKTKNIEKIKKLTTKNAKFFTKFTVFHVLPFVIRLFVWLLLLSQLFYVPLRFLLSGPLWLFFVFSVVMSFL
jgi:hypothetical protein